MSSFAAGTVLPLGNGYNFSVDARDLTFQYREMSRPGILQPGQVVYVGEPPFISGDFDDNGDFACADVDALVAEIVSGNNTASFDLTQDGVVDNDDLEAWLAQAGAAELASGNPYLPGDANLDGSTNGADFLVWNTFKFTNTAAWCAGDFDASGAVNGADFLIWNDFKFQSADGVSAVPEPTAGLLILCGVLGLSRRRR